MENYVGSQIIFRYVFMPQAPGIVFNQQIFGFSLKKISKILRQLFFRHVVVFIFCWELSGPIIVRNFHQQVQLPGGDAFLILRPLRHDCCWLQGVTPHPLRQQKEGKGRLWKHERKWSVGWTDSKVQFRCQYHDMVLIVINCPSTDHFVKSYFKWMF